MSLSSHLTPDKTGVKAYLQAPFVTPWRTLIITENAPDMLASQLIYNLNEPCAIEDTSWIKPQKFMGVWWEMFTEVRLGHTVTSITPNRHHRLCSPPK